MLTNTPLPTNIKMTAIYKQSGFWVSYSELFAFLGSNYPKFIDKLTIAIIGDDKYQKQQTYCKLFRYEKGAEKQLWVILPRSVACLFTTAGVMGISHTSPPIKINLTMKLSLIENQKLICDELSNRIFTDLNISKGLAGCVLNLQAGKGKTFVAAEMISRLKLKTLFITLNTALVKQALEDFEKCFGSVAGKFTKDTKTKKAAAQPDISIIIINSALKQPPEFFAQFSFIVIDEIHEMCAEARREIFWIAQRHAMLGLSATTNERKDGLDIIYEKLCGEIVYAEAIELKHKEQQRSLFEQEQREHSEQREQQQIFKGEVKVINYYGPDDKTRNLSHPNTGKIFVPYIITQFFEDEERIALIISELRELLKMDYYVYMFCSDREPLNKLKSILEKELSIAVSAPELGTAPKTSLGMLMGGVKDDEISQVKTDSRVILITYGYGSTGISIIKMTAIIFVSPRKAKMKQIIGRILRKGSDPTILRRVVDIVDARTVLKHQFKERMIAYDYYGFSVRYTKHKSISLVGKNEEKNEEKDEIPAEIEDYDE